jgi:protein TonB
MNGKRDMTSQPEPGTTRREELAPCANRFTTDLLLQHASRAKTILSNLKDLLILRAPKFARLSASSRTFTIKDENFSRSQLASFAIHGSIALLLFASVVARPPFTKKAPTPDIRTYFAPPADYIRKLISVPRAAGDYGGGSGGERNPIPASSGNRPPIAREQIVAPSVHTFPNAQLQVTPLLEGPIPLPALANGMSNWGDINSKLATNSDGPGCCAGMGNRRGSGIGDGDGKGDGPGGPDGVGTSSIPPPGNGVRAPTCLYCPKPEYSDEARKVHFQGLVELSVVVLADGKPGRIELITGPGMGLDEKAIEAVRNWRFRPAIAPNGKAVAVTIPIEVQFQLF